MDLGAGMKHEPSEKEWAKLKAELLNEIKSDIRREAKVARRPLRIFRLTRVVWRNVSRRFDSSLFMRWGLLCLGFVVFQLPFLGSLYMFLFSILTEESFYGNANEALLGIGVSLLWCLLGSMFFGLFPFLRSDTEE